MAEYISPLLRDLQQLNDIARNIELANNDQPKSKKHEGEENISRKTLELERDKTKYMQVGGPVDTSASQPGS